VEGLETMPDGLFVYGFHEDQQLSIHVYDANICQTKSTGQIETPYNDIEGIAWPNRTTCEPTPHEQVQTYLESLDGIESVEIQTDGTIHYTQNGETHHAQLADDIVKGPPPADGLLTLTPIADANGDGIDDFKITYPNGNQQVVHYFGTLKEPSPSVKLQITSPIQNETVADNRILVEGTYEGPRNTGITVNGITALVSEGRFIANNVPLNTGENTLTATLITRAGETTTHSISITSQGTPSKLTLSASPSGGLAPLSVTFEYSLSTNTELSKLAIDFDGDGTNDLTTRDASATIQHDYNTPGLYVAKMQLTDDEYNRHEASTTVEVMETAQMDELFKSLWDEMNEALVAGDKEAALAYLNTAAQAKYDPVFEVLLPHMPEIVDSYSPLMRVSISSNIGEFAVNRTIDGELKIFFIYYLKGNDGVWRLNSM
jgi:hypothetical protein